MKPISFTSAGYKLAGNLFIPTGTPKKVAFLLIQGWQGHQNLAAAQALCDLGYEAMSYDMRGNEASEGNLADFSRADFVTDATVAYDYFKEQLSPDTQIGVIGSSFGSYTAVMLSEKRPVYCLSLRVPASYPDEGYDEPQAAQNKDVSALMAWREEKLYYDENRAFTALHNFNGKVLIMEAESDEIVPSQSPKNYADAVADKSNLTYQVVPDAQHRLATDELKADYGKRLVNWVTSVA